MNIKSLFIFISLSLLFSEFVFARSITLLDARKLPYPELSGMAYKDYILYIVSNDAKLYSFDIQIRNLKITKLNHLKTNQLKDKKHKVLTKKKSDAEGLCFMGENLLISFERDHRIELFNTDGIELNKVKIHKKLRNKKDYKDKNEGLESVAYSDSYGVLTTPQSPLKNRNYHTLYAKKREWRFNARGKVAAIEFIDENTLMILTLEEYFFSSSKRSRLYSVDLLQADKKSYEAELFFEKDGTFEGLTKIEDNLYLMVSDSEGGLFQKAELLLFELH